MILEFLRAIQYCSKLGSIIYVHFDNQSIIKRTQSNMYNGKSNHLDIILLSGVKYLLLNSIISL